MYNSLMALITIPQKPRSRGTRIEKRTNIYSCLPSVSQVRHFTDIYLNLQITMDVDSITPFYKQGNIGSETSGDLDKVTQRVSSKSGSDAGDLPSFHPSPSYHIDQPLSFKKKETKNQPSEYTKRQCYFSSKESTWMLIRPLSSLLIGY